VTKISVNVYYIQYYCLFLLTGISTDYNLRFAPIGVKGIS